MKVKIWKWKYKSMKVPTWWPTFEPTLVGICDGTLLWDNRRLIGRLLIVLARKVWKIGFLLFFAQFSLREVPFLGKSPGQRAPAKEVLKAQNPNPCSPLQLLHNAVVLYRPQWPPCKWAFSNGWLEGIFGQVEGSRVICTFQKIYYGPQSTYYVKRLLREGVKKKSIIFRKKS